MLNVDKVIRLSINSINECKGKINKSNTFLHRIFFLHINTLMHKNIFQGNVVQIVHYAKTGGKNPFSCSLYETHKTSPAKKKEKHCFEHSCSPLSIGDLCAFPDRSEL